MSKVYSVQEYQGHRNITVPADLVRAKGWEKGQGLKWEIKGDNKRVILKEGDDVKLQYQNNRYSVTVSWFQFLFDSVTGTEDYEFKWTVNEDGDLELIKAKKDEVEE